jgi:hypothetical protein
MEVARRRSQLHTSATVTLAETTKLQASSGSYETETIVGQNYLRDGNTVNKILRAFHADAMRDRKTIGNVIELGPGAGALTDKLVETYGTDILQCIEIDERSVGILLEKHPELRITHADVLQVNYPQLAEQEGQPLAVVGNLPYYSSRLFADASQEQLRYVTMQWHPAHGSKTETKLWWSFNCTRIPTVISKFHPRSFIRNPRWIRPWWGCTFWDRRDCANAWRGSNRPIYGA